MKCSCSSRTPRTISATNNESEFQLRFNVIARKLSGGNRSERGRLAQQLLPLDHPHLPQTPQRTLRLPPPNPLLKISVPSTHERQGGKLVRQVTIRQHFERVNSQKDLDNCRVGDVEKECPNKWDDHKRLL